MTNGVIVKLPIPCPHCDEEIREDLGRLVKDIQVLCHSCGRTFALVGEERRAALQQIAIQLSHIGTGG